MSKTAPEIERRTFATRDMLVEQRGNDSPVIEGYAAVFDQLSEPMWGFREKIAPGAFTRAIKEKQDVRALVDHDPSKVIGRIKADTLELRQDDHGLRVRINAADTTAGRDIVESIRRGDVDQMSFGFVIRQESVTRKGGPDGEDLRVLEDLDLFDVSPVTYPAYPQTEVGLRQFRRWAEGHKRSNLDKAMDLANNME